MTSETTDELVLLGRASYAATIGYGDVYRFVVDTVVHGTLADSSIDLTVLASDSQHGAFLAGHPAPRMIRISFARGEDEQPYRLAPVSGFVDSGRTSWLIQRMQERES